MKTGGWFKWPYKTRENNVLPFDTQEVKALIHHASEHGIDSNEKLLSRLNTAVTKYEHSGEAKTEDMTRERSIQSAEILTLYSQLTKLTHPVNGRTLLNSSSFAWHTKGLFLYAFLFLILSLGTEMLDLYLQDAVLPGDGPLAGLAMFHHYVLDFLSPLFWGGLGSCVFLLKHLGEVASKQEYDDSKFRGWNARVWVGAILASVVVYFYDPTTFTNGSLNLDANLVAFLAGLSSRVIYTALEQSINALSRRLTTKEDTKKQQQILVREYLVSTLSSLNAAKDQQNANYLKNLIKELDAKP